VLWVLGGEGNLPQSWHGRDLACTQEPFTQTSDKPRLLVEQYR